MHIGIFSFGNKHVWDKENPHLISEPDFQCEFKIWYAIIGDYLLGTYELRPALNG